MQQRKGGGHERASAESGVEPAEVRSGEALRGPREVPRIRRAGYVANPPLCRVSNRDVAIAGSARRRWYGWARRGAPRRRSGMTTSCWAVTAGRQGSHTSCDSWARGGERGQDHGPARPSNKQATPPRHCVREY